MPERSRPGPTLPQKQAHLIVNADDYGYFRSVSRGILASAQEGIVTATGVLPNAPGIVEQASWLRSMPQLDIGVHLNLSSGDPLSKVMRDCLRRWNGCFPGKTRMIWAITTGGITLANLREEIVLQIERCLNLGLTPRFLNSHEHVHMWPSIRSMVEELASVYGIRHVRRTAGDFHRGQKAGSLTRSAVLTLIDRCHQPQLPTIPCLGLAQSGRLSLPYFNRVVERLEPDQTYELMCHPGFFDPDEIDDLRLQAYHCWDRERQLLTSSDTRELLKRHGVDLVGYRDLESRSG